jgi:hypothetical protein
VAEKDITEMMGTYLKIKEMATKIGNISLLMIAEEKITQLETAIELKNHPMLVCVSLN